MRYTDPRLLDAICRTDFASFARQSFHTLFPSTQFQMNWHHRALAYHLEQVRLGNIKRLIINLPPGTLKSFMTSVAWPAYILGFDPSKRIGVVSHGSELAVDLGNSFRQIVNSPAYQRVFPAMQVSSMKNTELEVMTTRNGFRLGTTVEGALTGLHADIIIIDDPIKAMDGIHSDTKRDRVNTWFNGTLVSRLADPRNGAIILVMQRLHEDDLAGMLQRTSNQWTVLSLPAIADKEEQIAISDRQYHLRRVDDVLHPQRDTLAELLQRCKEIGPDIFDAQYQQAPIPAGGAMIKSDWLDYYIELPQAALSSPVFQSWDVASKDGEYNDWSVCTTWRRYNQKYYLIDLLRRRFDYPTLKERAISYAKSRQASLILIEDAGLGTALVAEMNKEGLPVKGVKPQQSKQMRLQLQLGKFRDRQVSFPRGAHFLPDLEAELLAFPRGRFDDQVDSICLALSHEPEQYDWDKVNEGWDRFLNGTWRQQQWSIRFLESKMR